ncbi:hypothetical protein AT05_00470 [Schleiferia thermophila str. Yellowstone]|uniref:hypothetical protein n=1 Tax=Schleiferia thermophila TaxID=884107 RepID=UPI0004E6E1F3|nr:hypothetical protein [Schleiferia thermophila]KFD40232.1 hypothetical protein AT05_00470 [Schleiferia thermophila str. Yellowstone]
MQYLRKYYKLTFIFLAFNLLLTAKAQKTRYWEYGIGLGVYHYRGDLNENFSVGNFIKEAGPRIVVHLRQNPVPWFNFGFEAGYGNSTIRDADYGRLTRNWEVYTESFDLNFSFEWMFLRYGKWHWENKITPYIKAGGGGLIAGSRGQNTIDLPESIVLHPYTYGSYNLFYGYGVKTRIGYHTTLFIQFTAHATGTDKMDGFIENSVATQKNDRYVSFIFGISRLVL